MLATPIVAAWLAVASPEGVPTFTVTVDLDAIAADRSNRAWFAEVYKGLLVRIAEDGMTIVGKPHTGAATLRFEASESDRLRVVVTLACHAQQVEIDLGADKRTNLALEIQHRSMDLLRRARALAAAGAEGCPKAETVTPTVVSPPPSSSPLPLAPTVLELGGAVAGTWSPGQTGLVYDAEARIGVADGWGLRAVVSVYQPLRLDDRLDLWELGAQVGGGYRLPLGDGTLGWRTDALVGYWQHRAVFRPSYGAVDRVVRHDAALTLATGLEVRLAPTWRAALTTGALVLSRERAHTADATTLWRATMARLLVGLSLAYGDEP